MSRKSKLFAKARRGAPLSFDELALLATMFGFVLMRVNGSFHIFRREGVAELLNLQNVKGKAKDYQIRQLLTLIEAYGLGVAVQDDVGAEDGEDENGTE
jgi:hypothetical protein